MTKKLLLYFDDTGSRDPDKSMLKGEIRKDNMDCFALGGILIKEEDIDDVLLKHKNFCSEWSIDYPLHSTCIRGGRGDFGWLKKPENSADFFPALDNFITSLPIVIIACVINRPGYVSRYRNRFNDRLWYMCKTAYCILTERSAKYTSSLNRKLEIYFEEMGKHEDRDIINYTRELKNTGNPFNSETSDKYSPLKAEDYKSIILGEPRRKTKKVPMLQIADLVLYPIAKSAYDPNYRAYKSLVKNKLIIDAQLNAGEIENNGIKYSCFDVIEK